MTTYKEIFGTNIEAVSSDPANPVLGQVWYNTTTNVVKAAAETAAGSWVTGGSLNTARRIIAGAGQAPGTLGFVFAGLTASPSALTELYNGSNWTELNDLSLARYGPGGAGTQTAALCFGGRNYPAAPTVPVMAPILIITLPPGQAGANPSQCTALPWLGLQITFALQLRL